MKNLRVKIYDLVSAGGDASVYAKDYDICMVFTIFASLMPLLVKNDTLFLYYVDKSVPQSSSSTMCYDFS